MFPLKSVSILLGTKENTLPGERDPNSRGEKYHPELEEEHQSSKCTYKRNTQFISPKSCPGLRQQPFQLEMMQKLMQSQNYSTFKSWVHCFQRDVTGCFCLLALLLNWTQSQGQRSPKSSINSRDRCQEPSTTWGSLREARADSIAPTPRASSENRSP